MKRLTFLLATIVAGTVGLVAGRFSSRFSLAAPQITVRQPQAPGEASIRYEPPAPEAFPVGLITENRMLMSMLRPRVQKVADDVYIATGFALGNVGLVVTSEGLVVIDTTESVDAAQEVLTKFREISPLPVRYIIYTHGHLDHVTGSPVFYHSGPPDDTNEHDVQVIASSALPDFVNFQFQMLGPFQARSRLTQGGVIDPGHAFPLPVERSPFRGLGKPLELAKPTILVNPSYSFTLGGKQFEVFRTAGETPDHLAVWMPGPKVLMTGDLFYASFPNLSTPMLEPRPVQAWYESLTKFMALQPAHLLPGHSDPVSGLEVVTETLRNYRNAVKFVHDETVRCIDEGKSVEEAVQEVKLPERLASLPYLQEHYGRVSWSVRGIYRGYTGWYDGRGTSLNPLPPGYREREIIALAGGVDKVVARAIELQKKHEHQMTLELCDLVIAANSQDTLAHRIKASSLREMAYSLNNINNFGFYRSAYALELKAADDAKKD